MTFDTQTYERIDNYLQGRLPDEERSAFEGQMSADKDLAEEVDAFRAVNELIVDSEILALKARIKTQYGNSKSDSSPKYYRYLFTSGIIIVSVVAAFMWFNDVETSETVKPLPVDKKLNEKSEPMQPERSFEQGEDKSVDIVVPEKAEVVKDVEESGRPASEKSNEKIEKRIDKIQELPNGKLPEPIAKKVLTVPAPHTISPIALRPEILPKAETEEPSLAGRKEAKPCTFQFAGFSVQTIASCADHPSGSASIQISEASDEYLPYQFALDESDYQSVAQFDGLYPGIYSLHVRDARGCNAEVAEVIEIPEKSCDLDYQQAFSPIRGETWPVPIEGQHFGQLNIFDRSGMLSVSISIRNGEPFEWDGRDGSGRVLPMGSYIFIILDNNGKVYKKGQVTLIK